MSLTAMRGWDYPPGGGVEVDRKEESGMWRSEGVERCVRVGVKYVLINIFDVEEHFFDTFEKMRRMTRNSGDRRDRGDARRVCKTAWRGRVWRVKKIWRVPSTEFKPLKNLWEKVLDEVLALFYSILSYPHF